MDMERAREFLLSLPDVVETEQFGGLVYWVGDKAIGGKMFCWLTLMTERGRVAAFAAEPEHFHELIEREDLFPSPYLARIHWVAARNWHALRDSEWRVEFTAAAEKMRGRLAPKAKKVLAMSKTEQRKAVAEARKKLRGRV